MTECSSLEILQMFDRTAFQVLSPDTVNNICET